MRTGEALEVDVSLFAQGCWAMSSSLIAANLAGREERATPDRRTFENPLTNTYRTADGRWVVTAMTQADRYWPGFCQAIGHEELIDDPRFADMSSRAKSAQACIETLDAIFAARPLAHWQAALATQEGPFTVAQRVGDLNRDEQAWANGYLQRVDYGEGRQLTMVTAPVQFNGETATLRRAPEFGESTEEVLLELGHSWDDITRYRDANAIG
jgi:crotonobetainyl-CoA:carnitine CoA-transferase CaiB-like acyl-CoA transferase